VLYDELDLGVYEFVLTNFHAGALVRYRIGDLFEVIALEDKELDSPLPQLRFYSRADDVIDLGNLVRLTESDIWKAIEATGVKYQDWTARKDINNHEVNLHIYLEPKPSENITVDNFRGQIALELSKLSSEFDGLDEILGRDPVQVSFLQPGSFDAYMKQKQQEGADLAHIKPPHMQPTNQAMKQLQEIKGKLPNSP
jgi:phenylacetate-coenzyme A ligase PaaK-like adenylate-forming protein